MSFVNPCYPPPSRSRPREAPTLPVERFRLLGAPDTTLAALDATWEALDEAGRGRMRATLDAIGDDSLGYWLLGLEPVPDATAEQVADWAAAHATPVTAARVARAVEEAAAKPRVTLLARLDRIIVSGDDW